MTEGEVSKVIEFIKENNQFEYEEDINLIAKNGESGNPPTSRSNDVLEDFSPSRDDDELFDEAVAVVREAEKASASYLQRRLKVGYARAARLLDLMEEAGLIGPGEGAKPREIYAEKIDARLEGEESVSEDEEGYGNEEK